MDFHTKSRKSPDPGVPMHTKSYMYKSRNATVNTSCKLGLPEVLPVCGL